MDLGRSAKYETSFMSEKVQGNSLPEEVEEGNVEYKVSLLTCQPLIYAMLMIPITANISVHLPLTLLSTSNEIEMKNMDL
jgi:hypothetical protein